MLARPLVGVQNGDAKAKVEQHVQLPTVFQVPIRPDLINSVFARMSRNRRQAHSVSRYAGHQTSAESWGTGRAVARIPRVPGGGTHRAGQGAFGNMCRGGRMFGPTRTWRRWHRRINVTEKRYAMVSAISASAIPSLVFARGHRIEKVAEIPLVVDNKAVDSIDKTKRARDLLKELGAFADVQRVIDSKALHTGRGKSRNRRYVQRRGPLIVFNEKGPLVKAFRNIAGVELSNVNHMNLLQLAPGGHIGRFVIWTKDAFEKLDEIYGTYKRQSIKKGYKLPRPMMSNADVSRILNSDEIQNAIRPKKTQRTPTVRVNPYLHRSALIKLNPFAGAQLRRHAVSEETRSKKRAELLEAKRSGKKAELTDAQKKSFATKKATKKQHRTSTRKFVKNLLAK